SRELSLGRLRRPGVASSPSGGEPLACPSVSSCRLTAGATIRADSRLLSYSKARLSAGLRCPWAPTAGLETASLTRAGRLLCLLSYVGDVSAVSWHSIRAARRSSSLVRPCELHASERRAGGMLERHHARALAESEPYRFENCGALRALCSPAFLRSTWR